jgi:hypothetical protein
VINVFREDSNNHINEVRKSTQGPNKKQNTDEKFRKEIKILKKKKKSWKC